MTKVPILDLSYQGMIIWLQGGSGIEAVILGTAGNIVELQETNGCNTGLDTIQNNDLNCKMGQHKPWKSRCHRTGNHTEQPSPKS